MEIFYWLHNTGTIKFFPDTRRSFTLMQVIRQLNGGEINGAQFSLSLPATKFKIGVIDSEYRWSPIPNLQARHNGSRLPCALKVLKVALAGLPDKQKSKTNTPSVVYSISMPPSVVILLGLTNLHPF